LFIGRKSKLPTLVQESKTNLLEEVYTTEAQKRTQTDNTHTHITLACAGETVLSVKGIHPDVSATLIWFLKLVCASSLAQT